MTSNLQNSIVSFESKKKYIYLYVFSYKLLLMLEQELHLERELFFLLNGSDHAVLDNFFYLYSYKWTWVPLYLCFLFVFVYRKNWKEILCVLFSIFLLILLCDQISSGFFKPFFERLRPTHHPDFKEQVDIVLGYRGGRYGFVSSHAANTSGFAVFTALLFRNRYYTLMIVLFSLLASYSRIYLGVHFISDVIAGILLGVVIGFFVYKSFNYARYKWIKVSKDELTDALYPSREAYVLSGIFSLTLVLLIALDNQLVGVLLAFN